MNRKIFIAIWFFGLAASLFIFTQTAEAKKMSFRPIGIKLTLPKTWKNARWSFTQYEQPEGCPSSPPWNVIFINVDDKADKRRSLLIYEVPKEFTACPAINNEWRVMKKKRKKYLYYWVDNPERDQAVRKEQEKIAKSARFIRRQPPSIIFGAE